MTRRIVLEVRVFGSQPLGIGARPDIERFNVRDFDLTKETRPVRGLE
jgi:hypothetical protein